MESKSLPDIVFGPEDYWAINQSIKNMSSLSPEEKQRILDEANKELPSGTRARCDNPLKIMEDREEIYHSKLHYSQGLGEDLMVAVADYLLCHKELVNQNS